MSNLSAIIVDDERRGRELLKTLLQVNCPDITVTALAATLDEAIAATKQHAPDIIFLDVRLGSDFGFDLLPYLPNPAPAVIITTAHEQYAIKALRSHATDYLLKPIVSDELKAAVERTKQKIAKASEANPAIKLSATKKFAIPTSDGSIFIDLQDIIRCEAKGAYTEIFLKEQKSILTSANLGEFEKTLSEQEGFFRIHHSSIINLAQVHRYVKTDGGFVIMSDQSKVQISQRKKGPFTDIIKTFQKLG